jgi:hypothetical protein
MEYEISSKEDYLFVFYYMNGIQTVQILANLH